jgi:hypothetical protein
MLIGDMRPTTLAGVKSLAAQLRKESGLKHSVALDLAARVANCSNYTHARRTLPLRTVGSTDHYVLLTAYWSDREKRYARGRETLRIELSRPLSTICDKATLRSARSFGDLRLVADDHYVCDTLAPSRDTARKWLMSAERSLRFIERSGLVPETRRNRKARRAAREEMSLPGQDHSTDWIDPATGQLILIDEPYSGVPNEEERRAWEARTGWRVIRTSWPGMYNPYACDLYVATDVRGGYDLKGLAERIDAMPPPLREEEWSGESADGWDTFLSPMAATPQDVRRARSRGTIFPVDTATTIPYSYAAGSARRRPRGELGVEGHIRVGSLIKAMLQSPVRPWGLYSRLNSLRATLEDWLALEIGRNALHGPEFFDVYYNSTPDDAIAEERAGNVAGVRDMLAELRTLLTEAYPDCAPLRRQLGYVASAEKMMACRT